MKVEESDSEGVCGDGSGGGGDGDGRDKMEAQKSVWVSLSQNRIRFPRVFSPMYDDAAKLNMLWLR